MRRPRWLFPSIPCPVPESDRIFREYQKALKALWGDKSVGREEVQRRLVRIKDYIEELMETER